MSGRCATCKWWRPQGLEPGQDRSQYIGEGKGMCALTDAQMGIAVWPHSLAVASDGEEYAAVLVTAADFGCVQHEPKP